MSNKYEFKVGAKVVYPAHGVGVIKAVKKEKVGGTDITAYIILFEKDKMTLMVPVNKAKESGLRILSSVPELEKVRKTLLGKAKTGRGMWSRRAKEYESKINSGNIVFLAEVVRDLHKNVSDPDRSYSERIIYENALNRLAGEFAAVEEVDHNHATDVLVKTINDNKTEEDVAA